MNIIHIYKYNTEQFTILVKSPLSPAQKKGIATSLSLRQKWHNRGINPPPKIRPSSTHIKRYNCCKFKGPRILNSNPHFTGRGNGDSEIRSDLFKEFFLTIKYLFIFGCAGSSLPLRVPGRGE